MNTFVATLVLALVVIVWIGLALLPALLELWRRTDVAPLQLRRGGGDVRHFALGFQRFVDGELAARGVDAPPPKPGGSAIALRDGEPAWLVRSSGEAVTLPLAWMPVNALATHVVLSEADLVVPADVAVLKELYVAGSLEGGKGTSYRAVLARRNATLGARSEVLRWIDTGGRLEVGERSRLHGRASSSVTMRLMDGVRFDRVAAPSIAFGTPGRRVAAMPTATGAAWDPATPLPRHPALETPAAGHVIIPRARPSVVTGTREPLQPPRGVTESFGRWLIDGDFAVPDGEYVVMDVIVTGTLTIGAGARVLGAVKAAVLTGGPGAIYNGAIVATDRLELGAGSVVAGPVVVEGTAAFGAGSRIGTPIDQTTISAVAVRIGRESIVCGEVWARAGGVVDSD